MAPVPIGISTSGFRSTRTISLALPSGARAGDYGVVVFGAEGDVRTGSTYPSGWTVIGTAYDSGTGTIVALAGPLSGTTSIIMRGSFNVSATLMAYSGVGGIDRYSFRNSLTTAARTMVAPGVTVSEDDSMAVWLMYQYYTGDSNIGLPSGYTRRSTFATEQYEWIADKPVDSGATGDVVGSVVDGGSIIYAAGLIVFSSGSVEAPDPFETVLFDASRYSDGPLPVPPWAWTSGDIHIESGMIAAPDDLSWSHAGWDDDLGPNAVFWVEFGSDSLPDEVVELIIEDENGDIALGMYTYDNWLSIAADEGAETDGAFLEDFGGRPGEGDRLAISVDGQDAIGWIYRRDGDWTPIVTVTASAPLRNGWPVLTLVGSEVRITKVGGGIFVPREIVDVKMLSMVI